MGAANLSASEPLSTATKSSGLIAGNSSPGARVTSSTDARSSLRAAGGSAASSRTPASVYEIS